MSQNLKIKELVSEYYNELDQRNYGQAVKWTYHKVCRQILGWCNENNIDYFNEKTGNQFCDEVIGGHLSKTGSTLHYRTTLRVVRMLVTLQQSGDFECRSPWIEYKFDTILGEIAPSYLDYCATIRKYAATSISERKRAMFRFDIYLSNNKKSIEEISVELFEDFLAKHCSKNSRRHYKVFFRDIFRYCFDNGILKKDFSSFILKEPRVARGSQLPTTYTEDEIKRIIKAIDRSSAKGKRDYLILLLAAEYGWRASDITSFSTDEIDWDKNIISITQTKTGVPVQFPLLASIGNAIIDYLKHGRPTGGDHHIIIVNHENTHKGNRLTSATVHSIVSKAMKLANIPNWRAKKHGPHSLRHSLASNMLKQNISIPIIKTVLGHQTTQSTKTYLTIDIEKLRLCSLPTPRITSEFYHQTKKY